MLNVDTAPPSHLALNVGDIGIEYIRGFTHVTAKMVPMSAKAIIFLVDNKKVMANSLCIEGKSGPMTVFKCVHYESGSKDDKWKDISNYFGPDGERQPLANIDAFLEVCR